jgi:hypothetical protein
MHMNVTASGCGNLGGSNERDCTWLGTTLGFVIQMNLTAPALGHNELAVTKMVMQLNETAPALGHYEPAFTKSVIQWNETAPGRGHLGDSNEHDCTWLGTTCGFVILMNLEEAST